MAKNDFWKNLGDFMTALSEHYDEEQKRQEEERAELRKEFEDTSERKVYNRGTVIAAMAEQGWDDYDMRRVLDKVTNSERAEAAVGLIKTGSYDAWDVGRIIEKLLTNGPGYRAFSFCFAISTVLLIGGDIYGKRKRRKTRL